ncbi:MAG: hypothetical protein HYT87_18620 [Nitrospirae bacterium]|nr:hypothetical protein [Nitrospirota bacterium]
MYLLLLLALIAQHSARSTSVGISACARLLDIGCRAPDGIGTDCYDPCRDADNKAACREKYRPVAEAVYGACPDASQVKVYCNNRNDVDDTGMCTDPAQERPGMPFAINAAPLDEQGNTLEDYSCNGFNNGCGVFATGHGDGNVMTFTPPSGDNFGSRRYSFAIVPQKLYVPTETQFSDTLSLFEDPDQDGVQTLKEPPERLQLVLEKAEGAYVEGVIRFEEVPAPSQVIARRPRLRAP